MRVLAAVLAAGAVLAAAAAGAPSAGAAPVRVSGVQVVGTHNSYKREISEAEQALYDAAVGRPGEYDATLAYGHAPLRQQLEGQRVRGLELDLFPDPAGGLYAEPLIRRVAGLGPLADPEWRQPGIKVLHIADLDYETTCVRLVACLRQVRSWSRARPRHVPVFVLLELKQSEQRLIDAGGVVAPPWDAAALDTLDREIRSVLSERELLTPDDVRRPGRSLERSVRTAGWPALRRARGTVAFLLDNEPGRIRDAYGAGRPDLQGRVLFTNAVPGERDAAFLKRNAPLDGGAAEIRRLVRRGYLVRTRADEPLATVLGGGTRQRDAALASGAQVVSTDFPVPGMAARYGSDFVTALPGGRTARCNPVTAPPSCRSALLEPVG